MRARISFASRPRDKQPRQSEKRSGVPSFKSVRRVPYSARQMFDVVADVERYPDFVPLCESLVITSSSESQGQVCRVATMGIGYKSIRERFTTRVVLQPDVPAVEVSHVDGPFRRLENLWRFVPASATSCDVHFFIDYEFRSKALALVMGALFDSAFRKFSAAFEDRARAVYGPILLQK